MQYTPFILRMRKVVSYYRLVSAPGDWNTLFLTLNALLPSNTLCSHHIHFKLSKGFSLIKEALLILTIYMLILTIYMYIYNLTLLTLHIYMYNIIGGILFTLSILIFIVFYFIFVCMISISMQNQARTVFASMRGWSNQVLASLFGLKQSISYG